MYNTYSIVCSIVLCVWEVTVQNFRKRGLFYWQLSINSIFRLPVHWIDFQADVAAIKVAVDVLLRKAALFR